MAVREIKTTIALDGEQKFKQAIAAASREMRVMDSELKAVTAAYENNGDAAAYYAQKQANLKNQISQQKNIIDSLEQAVKDATQAYGAGSSEVDGYAIKLNNARTRMSKLEKQLEETDREVEELGRDSIKAGRQLEQGIGEGAEEAEKDVKSLIRTMQEDISSIRTSGAVSAITGLWNMATSAFSSVEGFVSGTAELRRQMSFLEQNAKTQGFDFEFIKGQLTEVTTLTGDTSASIETVSNLMAVPGMEAGSLVTAVDLLAGAVASFPDTLKFESLADSLQETLATGEATGAYAELLGRLGVNTEDFNKALAESKTDAGDLNIALAYLAEAGMSDVYEQWRRNNQAMIDASETQSELEGELAEFGGTLESYIVTPVKELLVDALKLVNDTIEDVKEGYNEGDALERANAAKEAEERLLSGTGTEEDLELLALRAQEMRRLKRGNLLDNLGKLGEGRTAQEIIEGIDLDAYYAELEKKKQGEPPKKENRESFLDYIVPSASAEEAGEEAGKAYYEGFKAAANTGQNGAPTLEQQLTDFLMQDLDMSLFTPKEATGTSLLDKWKQTILDAQEALKEAEPDLKEGGEEAGEALADGFEIGANGVTGRAKIAGMDAGKYFGMGLLSQVSYVTMASAQLAAAAASRLASGGAVSGATGMGKAGTIVMQLDGREVGRALLPYQSEGMAVTEVNVE